MITNEITVIVNEALNKIGMNTGRPIDKSRITK